MDLNGWEEAVPLMAEGYHRDILEKVNALREVHEIYPPQGQVLRALTLTPFDAVKVVILGQDPYYGEGQADGLAFSVPEDIPAPPSLRNIFKEIADDVYDGALPDDSTDLSRWAVQGVLLLNAILTVEAGKPASQRDLGWIRLTDAVIQSLAEQREHLVFMLWGRFAQSKRSLIPASRHLVLEAPHPSPLSARRGFFGCRHFSKCNAYLREQGLDPIVW